VFNPSVEYISGGDMGRIMAVEFVTLDGVFEEPTWTQAYFDDAVGAYQGEAMHWADALLLGRVTYDGMSQAWPAMGNDPSTGGDIMNSASTYRPRRSPIRHGTRPSCTATSSTRSPRSRGARRTS
jgi:hypothetical protein